MINFPKTDSLFNRLSYWKRTLLILFLGVGGAGAIWYFTKSSPPLEPAKKIVEVEEVHKRPLLQTTELIGTVKAGQQATLTVHQPGRLDILVSPNTLVKKKEIIARIHSPSLARSFALSEKVEDLAQQQLNRALALSKAGYASKKMVEEKQKELLEAQQRKFHARVSLEETQIKAPFDGEVGIFKKNNGAEVSPGDIVVNFYAPQSKIIEFDIPLATSKFVTKDTRVIVKDKSFPLVHIQKMLDDDTHMCPAFIELGDSNETIGTTLPISLVSQEKDSEIVIPYEAIFMKDGKSFVYTIKEGLVQLTPIEVGIRQKDFIEITKGLSEGDQLVVKGHRRLFPSEPVEIYSLPVSQVAP